MTVERITVKIRRLGCGSDLPAYATPGAAGVDLRACLAMDVVIKPGEIARIPTGLAFELPDAGTVALLCARSGLASEYGITLANGVGVLDSDYRGEVQVALINLGREPFTVRSGDRIAQVLFLSLTRVDFELAEDLSVTARGEGGFGSTGI
ncbi:deoxyuridine 5'-triphosphate nucleotidohydrolase [Peptococcaceae bacterium CEB3]|nr:deoxyuridine 5'-triphosphate nucleotidohydrolase [Peptococcaceae bacterium CEB3]